MLVPLAAGALGRRPAADGELHLSGHFVRWNKWSHNRCIESSICRHHRLLATTWATADGENYLSDHLVRQGDAQPSREMKLEMRHKREAQIGSDDTSTSADCKFCICWKPLHKSLSR